MAEKATINEISKYLFLKFINLTMPIFHFPTASPTPAFNFAGGAGSGTGGSSMFAMFGGSEEPSQVENTQGQGDFNFSFGGGPASPVVSGGSAGFSLF